MIPGRSQAPPRARADRDAVSREAAGQRFQTMADVKIALGAPSTEVRRGPRAVDCRAPIRQSECGQGERVLQRRARRGDHQRARACARPQSHCPHLCVRLPRQGARISARSPQTLGVRSVLEGSVRRSGSRIRVTAQLIDAEGGHHLWSERYDREMADVFAIQDDIAAAIASALQTKLSVAPAALRRYTPNLPAYEAYPESAALHGAQDAGSAGASQGMAGAGDRARSAIRVWPTARSASTSCGSRFPACCRHMTRCHCVRAAARTALSIDPSLPDAHALLGAVAAIYDYDWVEAERLYRLATRGDPVPPIVRFTSMLYAAARWPVARGRRGVRARASTKIL